ncbi:MAG TPA: hypothetical protein VME20_05560 [Acidimicrobiales bacterium]|nr:hypothetical protein [Acidimicrobiales bacterium]
MSKTAGPAAPCGTASWAHLDDVVAPRARERTGALPTSFNYTEIADKWG